MCVLQTTVCRSVDVYIVSMQDSPAGLLDFERVTGTTKEDILNPRWTAVITLTDHCTPEQIETSVMQLVEVRCYQWSHVDAYNFPRVGWLH